MVHGAWCMVYGKVYGGVSDGLWGFLGIRSQTDFGHAHVVEGEIAVLVAHQAVLVVLGRLDE